MYKKYMIQFATKERMEYRFADTKKEIDDIYEKYKDDIRTGYFDIFKIKNVGFIDFNGEIKMREEL